MMIRGKGQRHSSKKFNFIMFEIVFALLVVMFGIFGVSGIIPFGMNSQKTSVTTSYVVDAAEQLLRLNARNIKKNWDWLNVFANSKPDHNDQGTEWSSMSLFDVDKLRIKPDIDFDPVNIDNSGLFLLEQLDIGGRVEQTAILHFWKDVRESTSNSSDVIIYVEASWPGEKPYYARSKEVFSLQLSKAPERFISDTIYDDVNCQVAKTTSGGYETTLAGVTYNADDTYTIELTLIHNGCSGPHCPELTDFSVEADAGTYSNVSFSNASGVLDLGPHLENAPFQGFQINSSGGIGNGNAGTLNLTYTVTELQDQRTVIHGEDSSITKTFGEADFAYALNCSAF